MSYCFQQSTVSPYADHEVYFRNTFFAAVLFAWTKINVTMPKNIPQNFRNKYFRLAVIQGTQKAFYIRKAIMTDFSSVNSNSHSIKIFPAMKPIDAVRY